MGSLLFYKRKDMMTKMGRPRISEEIMDRVATLYYEDKLTCNQIAKQCGISKASLYRIMHWKRAEQSLRGTKKYSTTWTYRSKR